MQKNLRKQKTTRAKAKENAAERTQWKDLITYQSSHSYQLSRIYSRPKKIDDDDDLRQAINGIAMAGSAADSRRQTKVINCCKIWSDKRTE